MNPEQQKQQKKFEDEHMKPYEFIKTNGKNMDTNQIRKIEARLKNRGFTELSSKRGIWVSGKTPNMRGVDLNKTSAIPEYMGLPQCFISTGTERIEQGHGISEVDDIRQEIATILQSKSAGKNDKKEQPAPEQSSRSSSNTKCEDGAYEAKEKAEPVSGKSTCITHDNIKPEVKDELPKEVPTQETNIIMRPGDQNKTEYRSYILELIQKYVGNDVLEIFGETGSGKSKFGLEIARQAIASSKRVFYLDTERNLTDADIVSLQGSQYKYTPILEEIDKIVRDLPKVDVVIIDSIGFPVLTTYARLSLKQKGDALLKLIAIFGDLKAWAYRNNGVAVVMNQPESEFNKEIGHILRPFGDKSQFAAKEIWKTEISQRSPTSTKINITAFRSRSVGYNTKIASMEVTSTGVEIIGV